MFFKRKRKPSPFVKPEDFEVNLKKQLELAPRTHAELRKHGISDDSRYRLEFFFYTNSSENAQQLNAQLQAKGYQSHTSPAAYNKRLFVITGWSAPVPMDQTSLLEWTEMMCRVGFEHDCEFDGWGTLIDQSQIPNFDLEQPAGSP